MILHIPHSSTRIPSYEDTMQQDKAVLDAIEKYTDYRTSELFYHKRAERVEFNYSRVFCDVEKLEKNEPMELLGRGILYDVSRTSRKHPDRALKLYKEHHKKLFESVQKEKDLFKKVMIVDCHSFSNEQAKEQGVHSNIPDICLGVDNIHTPSTLLSLCQEHFEKDGYSIGINTPFSGTIVPLELYGNKDVLSIMIELNKAIYANEEDFNKLKNSITLLLEKIEERQ
jgi:N-formylglutamate amidohydrolase